MVCCSDFHFNFKIPDLSTDSIIQLSQDIYANTDYGAYWIYQAGESGAVMARRIADTMDLFLIHYGLNGSFTNSVVGSDLELFKAVDEMECDARINDLLIAFTNSFFGDKPLLGGVQFGYQGLSGDIRSICDSSVKFSYRQNDIYDIAARTYAPTDCSFYDCSISPLPTEALRIDFEICVDDCNPMRFEDTSVYPYPLNLVYGILNIYDKYGAVIFTARINQSLSLELSIFDTAFLGGNISDGVYKCTYFVYTLSNDSLVGKIDKYVIKDCKSVCCLNKKIVSLLGCAHCNKGAGYAKVARLHSLIYGARLIAECGDYDKANAIYKQIALICNCEDCNC
jgi:hypothetical protein